MRSVPTENICRLYLFLRFVVFDGVQQRRAKEHGRANGVARRPNTQDPNCLPGSSGKVVSPVVALAGRANHRTHPFPASFSYRARLSRRYDATVGSSSFRSARSLPVELPHEYLLRDGGHMNARLVKDPADGQAAVVLDAASPEVV